MNFELGWREMLNDEFRIKNRAGHVPLPGGALAHGVRSISPRSALQKRQ